MKFCGQCGAAAGRPVSVLRLRAILQNIGFAANAARRWTGRVCRRPFRVEPFSPKPAEGRAANPGAALPGEMKQVTVLFCDIVGSTPLTERLGAEAMRDLVSSFLATSLAEVDRYGGTAPQFTGDGFMALFGAPVTQEDHVQRALLAALAIQRALAGPRTARGAIIWSCRCGSASTSGPVVFGPVADRFPMDYTAIGDTANVAARIQQAAEPATILLSEATTNWRRAMLWSNRSAPSSSKVRPIRSPRTGCSDVSQARAALRPSTAARRTTFVDRQSDLAVLNDVLRQVESGHRQAVDIIGEPGIGKSRLLSEFRRQLASERVTWIEGRCVSYGTAIPYLLMLDLLRSNCGILETDTPESMIAKVRSGLERIGIDPDQDSLVLLHLLGVKDAEMAPVLANPEAVKAKTFDIFRQVGHQIESRTAPGPRARGSALGRQNLGRVSRVPGREYRRRAHSNAGDLSAGVPSAMDRQILRGTGRGAAIVAGRQYRRCPLGAECRADYRTGHRGDRRQGGRQSALSRAVDPSRRRGEGPSIEPDGTGHDP